MTLDTGLYHLSIKLSVINMHWGMISHLTFLLGKVKRLEQNHVKQFIILSRNKFFQ